MNMPNNSQIIVQTEAIEHNLREIRKHIGSTRLLAVVKADAYGHGAVEIARLLLRNGIDYLGVALPEEALELRQAGIAAPILIMSPCLPDQYQWLINQGCTLTVNRLESAIAIQAVAVSLHKNVKIHININTGMYRYGIAPQEALELAKTVVAQPNLELQGIYTHFPLAESKVITKRQLATFLQVCAVIEEAGIRIPLKHCANSTAMLQLPESHLDMVRVGTALFGQARVAHHLALQPTWQLQARITNIIHVPKGAAIGYGCSYQVKRDSQLAMIPLGFADGISMWPVHRTSNLKGLLKELVKSTMRYFGVKRTIEKAIVKGHLVPYVGKVGMQHLALDITDFPDITLGDVATVRILQASVNRDIRRDYPETKEKVVDN